MRRLAWIGNDVHQETIVISVYVDKEVASENLIYGYQSDSPSKRPSSFNCKYGKENVATQKNINYEMRLTRPSIPEARFIAP